MRHVLIVQRKKRDETGPLLDLQSVALGLELDIAHSGTEALAMLSEHRFDIVAADRALPDMTGLELLNQVMDLHPETIRLAFTGKTDNNLDVGAPGAVHQFVRRDVSGEAFERAIARAARLHHLVTDEAVLELVTRIQKLPSLPSLYLEIVAEAGSDDPSLQRVGEIVTKDVSMAAKVMQLANSAVFGLAFKVSDPVRAVTVLGMEMVKGLVLMTKVFSSFDGVRMMGLSVEELWGHSYRVGMLARRIAEVERLAADTADAAFTGGLLHDIGKVILASNLPREYERAHRTAAETGHALSVVECRSFGATHCQLGGYLAGLWGLDELIVDAVLYHESPWSLSAEGFSAVGAVCAADYIDRRGAEGAAGSLERETLEYFHHLGMGEKLRSWGEITLD